MNTRHKTNPADLLNAKTLYFDANWKGYAVSIQDSAWQGLPQEEKQSWITKAVQLRYRVKTK